jgi:hypothetical protein
MLNKSEGFPTSGNDIEVKYTIFKQCIKKEGAKQKMNVEHSTPNIEHRMKRKRKAKDVTSLH